jgi:hypothetical protein
MPCGTSHAPATVVTSIRAASASHAVSYTLPSQAHTGREGSGQRALGALQTPSCLVPHAPSGYWQYFPAAHGTFGEHRSKERRGGTSMPAPRSPPEPPSPPAPSGSAAGPSKGDAAEHAAERRPTLTARENQSVFRLINRLYHPGSRHVGTQERTGLESVRPTGGGASRQDRPPRRRARRRPPAGTSASRTRQRATRRGRRRERGRRA